ncbi:hypothetical protein R1flu_022350 [Riccia fluitans]|uniref:PGG domain-containing protein n=1 Tax=Riccia fluitans TaxID=41844 RepID=A0ABD1ZSF4_9MARC
MAYAYETPRKVRWLKALHKGDCLQIEDLLNEEERLVTIYPRSCDSCPYAADFAAQFDGWKGCTALHVAVKRGWPFLVHKIVNLFKESPGNSAGDSGSGDRSNRVLDLAMLEELLLAFDSDYHLDALALAVVNGNKTIVQILAQAFSSCPNNPYRVVFPFSNGGAVDAAQRGSFRRLDEVDRSITGYEGEEVTGRPTEDMEEKKEMLWSIIEKAFMKLRDTPLEAEIRKYNENPAYNFLPMKLFFAHYWIVDRSSYYDQPINNQGFLTRSHPRRSKAAIAGFIERVLEMLRDRPGGNKLMKFLFSLKDGRGKTLAHVLASVYPYDRDWTSIISWDENEQAEFLNVLDGAGRTVPHEFVDGIMGRPTTADQDMYYYFLQVMGTTELTRSSRRFHGGLFDYFDLDALCTRNGYADHIYDFQNIFEGNQLYEASSRHYEAGQAFTGPKNVVHESSALHYAALHNCSGFFTTLIRTCRHPPKWNKKCRMRLKRIEKRKLSLAFEKEFQEFAPVNILQVAALSGSDSVFKALLEIDDLFDGTRLNNITPPNRDQINQRNGPFSVLFIASSAGDPAMIQALLASQKFDPLITTESSKDTALHFAADANYSGPLLQPTLLDLVNVSHRPGMAMPHRFRFLGKTKEEFIQGEDSRRKGCISLLLQAGIDIWQKNANSKSADPGENASPDFCSWWYEKLTKETQELRAGLNTAANAISVTAALVATASFVGPLQPPLSYDSMNKSSQYGTVHVEVLTVRLFMVCDTLALYFALIAILFSLMPLLPLPQESMLEDLSHVRKVVTASIAFLILSVVSFLVGFAAASIAVIPNEDAFLTLISVGIGGIFSLYLMYFFLLRLSRLICHKKTWIRRNYRKLTVIL